MLTLICLTIKYWIKILNNDDMKYWIMMIANKYWIITITALGYKREVATKQSI